ncbi:MAG: hypothetical protein EA377_11475 [Phycisphaerales bacterium]|nr:MAG: hypothetical protein EA377_11475 [Phycisphaerales bacterium]
MSETHPSRHRGLTLVEILVVVGLIVLLVALVTVAVNKASQAAARTQSANALREMIGGYNSYSADHNQRLMPGYIDEDDIGPGEAFNPRIYYNDQPVPDIALTSYVWRLNEYVGNEWTIFMRDYDNTTLRDRVDLIINGASDDDETLAGAYQLAAENPSFGLNSIFVGGNAYFESDIRSSLGIESDLRIAASRISQVRNPSALIVFGPSGQVDFDPDEETGPYVRSTELLDFPGGFPLGHHELRAPALRPAPEAPASNPYAIWDRRQWGLAPGQQGALELAAAAAPALNEDEDEEGFGMPIVRRGIASYPIAHLDGSVSIEDLNELASDMRRWSPFVTGTGPAAITD